MSDQNYIEDWLYTFDAGVNSGVSPLLLQKNQLYTAFNATVRGTLVRPRPCFRKIAFDDPSKAILAGALALGPYQSGGCYFRPDNADEGLMIPVGGHALQITPIGNTATVRDRTIPGDPNPPTQPQAWMWQGESWVFWNDGLSATVFIDNATATRSNSNSYVNFTTTTTNSLTIPAIGSSGNVDFTSVANLQVGDVFTVLNKGSYIVNSIAGTTVNFVNSTGTPTGQVLAAPQTVSWSHPGVGNGNQLPAGRMGTYGLGRNWVCLVDGKQFVGSDIVGSSSGTQATNFRDAIWNVTENTYLFGGGYFTVPGSLGEIQFMRFTATLDQSLGQGPLQVGTHNTIFSCQAPVDRTTWDSVTNPILTESLIGNGGIGHYSTILVNGDTFMRSIDGLRSLVLARREFATWGNTPQSREVDSQLSKDSPDLLPYGSAIYFDNRLLFTSGTVAHEKGNYFTSIVPLNFDPISSLRGKAPSVYDSQQWLGINVLQLFSGQFQGIERAFAITLNLTGTTPELELWEILPSADRTILDNDTTRVTWGFETPQIFNQSTANRRTPLTLWDGEIHVDDLQGTVNFQVYYKPDQYPCWQPWFEWSECAGNDGSTSKPQFRPRMGFGQPDATVCDPCTGDIMRNGFSFQVKVVITGHCRVVGMRFRASPNQQSSFAPQSCCP